MIKLSLFILSIILALSVSAQDISPYKIYTSSGKKVNAAKLTKAITQTDIVFFGELHNNPICHWLQLELTKTLYIEKGEDLVLGAEMFEADDQLKIDEYFDGLIKQSSFEKEARIWKNYTSDYKPVLEFAKDKNLKFVATNIPRRYASFVARYGITKLDTFPQESQRYMAPLPIKANMELESYKSMKNMGSMHGASVPYMDEAQAVKDATMAHFILENWSINKTFLHLNGSYHSNNYEGIVWFIKNAQTDIKIVTIASVEQDDVSKLDTDNKEIADFIIVINSAMCKTY